MQGAESSYDSSQTGCHRKAVPEVNLHSMKEDLEKCLETLRKGGTILYPTDTVWGIGCDATSEEAVKKIFQIKQRDESKSMIVLVEQVGQVKLYAGFPPAVTKLLKQAQSPLTVIYPNAKGLAPSLIAADGTVAIRVVKDDFCRRLIRNFGKPIVSTSANISGENAPGSFSEISETIKSRADYVVKWKREETQKNNPSSIIKVNPNGTIEVIRV